MAKNRPGVAPPFIQMELSLKTSLEQSMAVQVWITEGMDLAAESIGEVHSFDTDFCIERTRCYALSEISEHAASGSDADWRACVLRPFAGKFRGVAVLSMEADEALAWVVADGAKKDIVGTYIDLGGRLVEGLIESARKAVEPDLNLGCPRFREDTLTGCLLSTHAPSDTVAIASQVRVRSSGRELEGQLHVLMDPKSMGQLLGALSVSLH